MGKSHSKPHGTSQDEAKPERTAAQKAADAANLEKAKAAQEAGPSPYVPPDEGVSGTLADMQHVYRNSDKRHDKTGGQKFQREFSKKSPQAFNAQRIALEETLAPKKAEEVVAPVVDEGTERCEVLISRLLDEFEAEEAKRGQ